MTAHPDHERVPDDWHSLVVKAGPYTWTVTPDTVPAVGQLADGLSFGWSLPDGFPAVPTTPDPWELTFSVYAGSMAELSGLDIGSPVTVKLWMQAPGTTYVTAPGAAPSERPPAAFFVGRVTDMAATPTLLGGDPCVVVDVTAVDPTADLNEYRVGQGNWPTEPLMDRITRICNAAGRPRVHAEDFTGFPISNPTMRPRNASPITARAALVAALGDAYGLAGPQGIHTVMVPKFTAPMTGTATYPANGVATTRQVFELASGGANAFPGRLIVSPAGLVTLDAVAVPFDGTFRLVFSAHRVTGINWHVDKTGGVNQCTVTADGQPVQTVQENSLFNDSSGTIPAVDFVRETGMAAPYPLAGGAYVPFASPRGWAVDAVTLTNIPATSVSGFYLVRLFNMTTVQYLSNIPVVVREIPGDWAPDGRTYLAGQCRGARFTMTGGHPSFTLELTNTIPRAVPTGTTQLWLTWNDLDTRPTANPDPAWTEMDPGVSWFDLRLAGTWT